MELYYKKCIISSITVIVYIMSIISNVNGRQNSNSRDNFKANYFSSNIYEDSILKTPALIKKYGYPAEVHNVITDDGYVLQMHRIPNPGKTPVYLQHGLASSSAEFVFYGPKIGLAYILYDAGYDVWVGNHRGNRYCKRHINIKNNDIAFWNFTITELGKYDIKASIDRIIKVTKFEKIHYIGNSQGCAVIFILCDAWPEYSNKLIGVQAMAPAVFIKNLKSPLAKFGIYLMNRFKYVLPMFEGKILQNMADMGFASALGLLCHDGAPTQQFCGYILSLAVGFNMKETNKTMLPVLLNHFPSGASVLQVVHYKQFAETGEFKKFNYGRKKNLKFYGQPEPPFYDLTKMKANITLYHSSNDFLVVKEDVEHLFSKLKAPAKKILYDEYGFNHMNFIAGTHCNNFYSNILIKTMQSLDNELL